jgi:uncharacterized protein (DUF885 family)
MLLDRLAAAARAVVDVSLHAGHMDLPQAAEYLVEEGLLERSSAVAEVRRLTLAPAQSLAAFVGRLQILELREEARSRLGAKFNQLDFHAALLAGGMLPPALLREELWERLGVDS